MTTNEWHAATERDLALVEKSAPPLLGCNCSGDDDRRCCDGMGRPYCGLGPHKRPVLAVEMAEDSPGLYTAACEVCAAGCRSCPACGCSTVSDEGLCAGCGCDVLRARAA